MTTAFNIRPMLTELKAERDAIVKLDKATFTDKANHYATVGGVYAAIVAGYKETNPEATANTTFDKFKVQLEPIFGKTVLVNECLPMHEIGAKKLADAITKFEKVGLGPEKRGLRMDYLATAVRAIRDGRAADWKADGTLKSVSNASQTPAKVREAKAKVVTDTAKAVADSWEEAGIHVDPVVFDLRYFTSSEIDDFEKAIRAERARREAGGKVESLPG